LPFLETKGINPHSLRFSEEIVKIFKYDLNTGRNRFSPCQWAINLLAALLPTLFSNKTMSIYNKL
jgi:hypothetical protein